MEMFLSVQVVYRQGLVKQYLAPQNILMVDFMRVVRAEGKIKTIRYLPDVDRQAADLLVSTGNATRVEVRRQSECCGKPDDCIWGGGACRNVEVRRG